MRVYSGHSKQVEVYIMPPREKRTRQRILQMHADKRKEIEAIHAGDIAAVIGLKQTTTGDTLSDQNAQIILESMEFPIPVISVAVEPKSPGDEVKLTDALSKLAEEDPTFKTYIHPDTGQTIISGMGELHLEVILDRMIKEHHVEANVGKPQVSYKETISKTVDIESRVSKENMGLDMFAHVKVRVSPNERGAGHTFTTSIKRIPFQNILLTLPWQVLNKLLTVVSLADMKLWMSMWIFMTAHLTMRIPRKWLFSPRPLWP